MGIVLRVLVQGHMLAHHHLGQEQQQEDLQQEHTILYQTVMCRSVRRLQRLQYWLNTS